MKWQYYYVLTKLWPSGEVGAGGISPRGIIFDFGGKIETTYAWGLGRKTNNEAEWLALFLGIVLVQKENINKIIVFGDSKQFIQKMRNGRNVVATNCNRLYNQIIGMISNLQVTYYHILRQKNSLAEKMDNKGVKNKIGIVSIRDQTLLKHVP